MSEDKNSSNGWALIPRQTVAQGSANEGEPPPTKKKKKKKKRKSSPNNSKSNINNSNNNNINNNNNDNGISNKRPRLSSDANSVANSMSLPTRRIVIIKPSAIKSTDNERNELDEYKKTHQWPMFQFYCEIYGFSVEVQYYYELCNNGNDYNNKV